MNSKNFQTLSLSFTVINSLFISNLHLLGLLVYLSRQIREAFPYLIQSPSPRRYIITETTPLWILSFDKLNAPSNLESFNGGCNNIIFSTHFVSIAIRNNCQMHLIKIFINSVGYYPQKFVLVLMLFNSHKWPEKRGEQWNRNLLMILTNWG